MGKRSVSIYEIPIEIPLSKVDFSREYVEWLKSLNLSKPSYLVTHNVQVPLNGHG